MSNIETVAVAVTADGSGPLPLTWAQANMWDAIWGYGADTTDLTILRRIATPDGVPLPAALRAVERIIHGYEIARTTFDRDLVRQRVLAEVDLEIAVVDGAGDPHAATDRLLDRLRATPFEHGTAPPVRVGVVRDGATVRSVALALSHLAFDRHGASFLRDALATYLTGGEPARMPVQTTELLAREATDPLARQSRASLDRWTTALARLPAGRGIAPPAPGRYTVFEYRSVALAVAAQTIAERARVSSASVLLAGLSLALREVLAAAPGALQVIVSNRHHPDLSGLAGIALQNGLFVIPPIAANPDFDGLVRRAHVSAMWGYLNSRYDTRSLRQAVFAEQDRGRAPDLSYFFNDMRNAANDWSHLVDGRIDLRRCSRAEATEPLLVGEHQVRDFALFLHVLPDPATCSLRLICDDSVIDCDAAAAILRRIRDLVVGAALDPA